LTKLDRVFDKCKHIGVALILCLGIHQMVFSVNQGSMKESDSLKIDNSSIESRSFSDLRETYSGNEYVYERTVETSGWWTRFKQWFKELFNMDTGEESDKIIDMAFWIGASIIFLLVLFFLFKAIVNKEGVWVFGKSSDKNIIKAVDVEANIHTTNFQKLISDAESNNNYRLAIRYYYLWLLKKLSLAEIIEYDVEKTNSDYQNEIGTVSMKEKFTYTSYLYNYIWYGEFDVDNSQFSSAKKAFTHFIKSVGE